jgi:hypothetical protein
MRPSAIARTDAEVSIFKARYYCHNLAGPVRSIGIHCDEKVVATFKCKRHGLEMCCVRPKFALAQDHHQPRLQVLKFVQYLCFTVRGVIVNDQHVGSWPLPGHGSHPILDISHLVIGRGEYQRGGN